METICVFKLCIVLKFLIKPYIYKTLNDVWSSLSSSDGRMDLVDLASSLHGASQ